MATYRVMFTTTQGSELEHVVEADSYDQAVFHGTIRLIAELAEAVECCDEHGLETVFNRLCLSSIVGDIDVESEKL